MLRDDIARYTELSGNDGLHTPIGIIGAYLDGYEKGKADAQQERKKGKWIIIDSDEEKYEDIKCPNCKMNFTVDACRWCDIGFTVDDLKFCPNCGAEMEVSE